MIGLFIGPGVLAVVCALFLDRVAEGTPSAGHGAWQVGPMLGCTTREPRGCSPGA